MTLQEEIKQRSGGVCELCTGVGEQFLFEVQPLVNDDMQDNIAVCAVCNEQLNDASLQREDHWRCLNESIWSEQNPVKIVAKAVLTSNKSWGWSQDLLDMMYLEDDVAKRAEQYIEIAGFGSVKHIDANGVQLQNGDNVVLVKDLEVKGGNFTAKRGTAVKGIRIDPNNETYIEGKVDGQQIVLLTQYVKKN